MSREGRAMSATSINRPGQQLVTAGSAIVVLGVLALVASGPTYANRGTPDTRLLRTYQPVLVFHPVRAVQADEGSVVRQRLGAREVRRHKPSTAPARRLLGRRRRRSGRGDVAGLDAGRRLPARPEELQGRRTARGTGLLRECRHSDTCTLSRSSTAVPCTRRQTSFSSTGSSTTTTRSCSRRRRWGPLPVTRGRLGARQRRPRRGRGAGRGGVQPALLGTAEALGRCLQASGRKHASGRLRRTRLARELLRTRCRGARSDPDQPGLHPRRRGAHPADAAVPASRRPGGRRHGRRSSRRPRVVVDPADRGQAVGRVRRAVGRVRVLLDAHPARADFRRVPCRSASRLPARRPSRAGT